MTSFASDYLEGAHPRILERLFSTNMEQTAGYGCDAHCENAARLIQQACNRHDADVHFLVGGTQTNATVISSVLRPHQGVVCASTGHINVHETGAIEHSGHKVLALPTDNGLLTATEVEDVFHSHYTDPNIEHTVQPAMVYLSFPSELGTLYSKQQLTSIADVCQRYHAPLFIDGARLGYGLASPACDLTLADIAHLADIFYIGGTKQGALFGEALVICNSNYKTDFRYHIKQNGALLAKGRLLGIQFETLFEDGLYMSLSKHAIDAAMQLRSVLLSEPCKSRYSMPIDGLTNQLFVKMSNYDYERLSQNFSFDIWQRNETTCMVRICTSWATTQQAVEQLAKALSL